jgi:tRNA pseudouridine38-40 synthase
MPWSVCFSSVTILTIMPRIALGLSYAGSRYLGWQSQPGGNTVQDRLEAALRQFSGLPESERVSTNCTGRTDAGVHALMQVVHFDTSLEREVFSWMRGVNRFLPDDIAVQWAREVPAEFHCRASALTRRYAYIVLESAMRPSIEQGRVGWSFQPLSLLAMQEAAQILLGEHDFSSFRAAQCQALSPIKQLKRIEVRQRGGYYRFDFEANAFLHHMIRNIMGCLIMIGQGSKPVSWMQEVLDARSRVVAAPTFSADGLYFLGPTYEPHWQLPERTAAFDWLPI